MAEYDSKGSQYHGYPEFLPIVYYYNAIRDSNNKGLYL